MEGRAVAVIQPVNGREIRVPVGVLIFNLNVLLTFTATRFVQFLRPNETNALCDGEGGNKGNHVCNIQLCVYMCGTWGIRSRYLIVIGQ